MSTRQPSRIDTVLLLTAFLLPSSFQVPTLAIPVGTFYITAVEGIIFFLALRWMIDLLVSGRGYRHSLDKWIWLLLGSLVFSLFLGAQRYGMTQALADFRNFLPIFLYFWATRFYRQEQQLNDVRRKLFIVLLIAAAYEVVLFLFFSDAIRAYALGHNIKFSGTRIYFDNTLLLFIAYTGFLIGQLILTRKDRALTYAVLVANGLLLLLMQVRNFWVVFGLVVLGALLNQRKKILKTKLFFRASFTALLLISALLFLSNLDNVNLGELGDVAVSIAKRSATLLNLQETLFEPQSLSDETESIGTRLITSRIAWKDYIQENPLTGTGFGGELPVFSAYGGLALMKYIIDNGYLTLLAKFGILGTLPFVILLLKLFFLLLRISKSPFAAPKEKLLAQSFISMILAIMLASLFSAIAIRQISLLAWVCILAETSAIHQGIQARAHQREPEVSRQLDPCG